MPIYFGRLPRKSIPVTCYTRNFFPDIYAKSLVLQAESINTHLHSFFFTLHPFTYTLKMYRVFNQNLYNWKKIFIFLQVLLLFIHCNKLYLLFGFFWQQSDTIHSNKIYAQVLFCKTPICSEVHQLYPYKSLLLPGLETSTCPYYHGSYFVSLCFQFVRIFVLSSLSLFLCGCTL